MVTARQLAVAKLYEKALQGDPRAQFEFAESISHSDLPTQIVPTIQRTLTKRYQGAQEEQVHQKFTTRQLVDRLGVDVEYNVYGFDQDNIPENSMGDDFIPGGLPRIANRERYPQISLSASGKKLRADQLGEAFGVDWQAIVNSRGTEVNLIDDAVSEFARHASNEEDIRATKSLVTRSGFNTARIGTAGAIAGNPEIDTAETIQNAVAKAKAMKLDGVEINPTAFALLVTPSYGPAARQALARRRLTRVPARTGDDSAVVGDEYEETIDIGATITVVENKWLSAINPNFGRGWILVPTNGMPYPTVTSNYLRGYETPSFWVKNSNAMNYGGGEVPILEGDFDSDAIQTKVRHVNGSSVLWNEGIVYSAGTNA